MIDFLEDATNVYRTRKYIVKQCIAIMTHDEFDNVVSSQDTYYKRTRTRDKQYDEKFGTKYNARGKRLHTNMFTRTYVD